MAEPGTLNSAIQLVESWGVRCNALIDAGSAEGSFFVALRQDGLMADAVPIMFDANATYEATLRRLVGAVGGAYRIVALSDKEGELLVGRGPHSYWDSLRPPGDVYWKKINVAEVKQERVPARRLDDLMAEIGIKPPYFLRMDIQGAECAALAGATRTLKDTLMVLIEADLDDFQAINAALVGAGFNLFDLVHVSRGESGALGWFYPVYLRQDIYRSERRAFWHPDHTASAIEAQIHRQRLVRDGIEQFLARLGK